MPTLWVSITIPQALNKCEEALCQCRLDNRHNSILFIINTFITIHLSDSQILAEKPGLPYSFPPHIAATNKRPDIVTWKNCQCTLIELTVPFEDNFADAERRKRNRYEDLLQLCNKNGYRTHAVCDHPSWIQRSCGHTISVRTKAAVQAQCKGMECLCSGVGKSVHHRIIRNLV